MAPEALDSLDLTSELIRAARALLRWEQRDLAKASDVSLATIKRLETIPGVLVAHRSTVGALRRALESAGVEFTNGDAPGVRHRLNRRSSRPLQRRATVKTGEKK
jgi:transcriptional regulator with XRE-family HTH domain